MSYSKAHLFPLRDQKTARLAKAISHPARIGILRVLMQVDEIESKALYKQVPLSAPTIHQHLDFLTDRDIVQVDTAPAKAKYHVNRTRFQDLKDILDHCFKDLDSGSVSS